MAEHGRRRQPEHHHAGVSDALLDGKLQFRVKARYLDISADLNDDGTDDLDDSGFGDTDIRFLTVPYLDMANKWAIAVGLEVFLDTASKDILVRRLLQAVRGPA